MAQTASQNRKGSRSTQHARRRSLLLSSCSASAAALALMFVPTSAVAQDSAISAVEGTGSVTTGSATIVQTSTQDTVTVNSREAVIDWDLTDDAIGGRDIVFLPGGNTLLFTGGSEYTVLNRIVPTDATRGIRIDGTVQSRVGGAVGGNVWFYSPGGIIAGSTSVFDVGGLVLTTNNIDTTGGLFGPGGEIRFRGAAGSTSAVVVENGAQITAPNNGGINSQVGGSYVALVAPRVVQGGNVNVNGSVAYVGAEQADLTINNGLFDINVTVGTTDANGVVHEETGRTLGPSSTPIPAGQNGSPPRDPDTQAVYMVAVPKNDAITMLVSGNIGYFQAANASIVNGEVILSAGHNVSVGGTSENPTIDIAVDPVNAGSANIDFGSLTLNATTTMQASDTINLVSDGAQVISVNNNRYDLTATAGNQIDIGGTAGGSFRAGRNVTLRAGTAAQGGTINILVDRNTASPDALGVIQVDGNLRVDTSATGADDFFTIRNNGGTGVGEDAAGGDINIDVAQGGRFTVNGLARFDASAQGGKGEVQNGFAEAGDISVNLSGGTSSINLTGGAILNASAIATGDGKVGGRGVGQIGSDGTAGNISVSVQGGSFNSGRLDLNVDARATSGSDPAIEQSNDAVSGDILFHFTGGTHTINDVNISSFANSGTSYDAAETRMDGLATTGNFDFLIDSATVNITNDFRAVFSYDGVPTANSLSDVTLDILNGAVFALGDDFSFRTIRNSSQGNRLERSPDLTLNIDASTFSFDSLSLSTAINRDSVTSGDSSNAVTGGDLTLLISNGASVSGQTAFLSADALNSSSSGIANGGNVLIDVNNSQLTMTGSTFVNANGLGGETLESDASNPGSGVGGSIVFRVQGANGAMTFGNVFADSDGLIDTGCGECRGFGGFGQTFGDGGSAAGGTITFDLLGGAFTANQVNVNANGFGGNGGDIAAPAGRLAAAPAALAATIPAGSGGDGVGGDVVFNVNGGSASITVLNVTADGIGGEGAFGSVIDGTSGGTGGNGTGGNATFNGISGALNVTTAIMVSANGNSQNFGGGGGFGSGSDGGQGGNGTGGTATFNLDGTANINAATVLVSADGFAGNGGSSGTAFDPQTQGQFPAGNGGAGGTGVGGDAVFNNTAGSISFQQLTVQSNGVGKQGGDSFGQSTGLATGDGGRGGDGIAGTATINLNQDESSNPQYSVIANGTGGDGGAGLNSGDGGNATGGVAALNINNVNVQLAPPVISAIATGGNGGFGDGIGGTSGNGGNAQGGTARLETTGALGAIDLTSISMDASATGGNGGNGSDDFNFNNVGGDGGNGGMAVGGTSEIVARTGGTATLPPDTFTFTSTGTGGDGGNGGYVYIGMPGDGGDGANGTGGTARFLAQGGTINGNDITITTSGQGGAAGQGGVYGYYFGGANGADGAAGFGSGGLSVIEVQEGSPGIINFGATTIESSGSGGGTGGRIEITDTSVDPAGLITFDSLNATVIGLNDPGLTGFYMFSDSGAITVNGDATVDVSGNIEFDFVNDGRFDVTGNIDLASGADILAAHTSNSGVNSIAAGGTFNAVAQGDFNSMIGSLIVAGGTATVRAEQDATVDDIAGVGLVDISALQNVNLNNGAVTGAPFVINVGAGSIVAGPQLIVQAGLDNGTPAPPPAPPSSPSYDPNFNATITGNVTSTGNIIVNAGGNAVFVGGSNTISDNGLTVQTGDDIIIETGALVEAGANPATSPNTATPFANFNNLVLQAGGLAPISTALLTPISSIVAAGDINANDFAVVMSGNAIDGLGGTITAGSLAADINDAPSNATIAAIGQSDDNGLLSGECLQGNVCLGTLDVNNQLFIGQASNNDVVQAFVEGGNVLADTIRITTRRDLIVGTDGVASTFDGSTELLLESLEGDIDLRDASLSSDLLLLSAATGSLLGSGSLASANDIGITIGADLNAASIDTGGQLTTVADVGGGNEFSYTVPGSINVGTYTQGATTAFRVNAGADISFDVINLPADQNITLTAATGGAGDVFLGGATGAQDINLTGDNVGFGDLVASRDINLLANNGDVTGGLVNAGRLVDIDGQSVDMGDLTAGSITNVSASTGSITTGNVNVAATANFDAVTDITTGDVSARGFGFTAIAGGDISTGAVDTTSGGGVRDIILRAGGNVDFASINGNREVDIDGTSITGGDINAGGNINVLGTDLSLGNVASTGGFVTLEGTDGNVDAGVLTADSFGINITASDDVNFVSADANGGVTVDAGGDATFGDASAGASIRVDIGGNLAAGNLSAASASPGMGITVGGDADIASATSNGLLDVDVGGALTGGDFIGAVLTTLDAGSVDVGDIAATGGAVRVNSTDGATTAGTVSAATGITITSLDESTVDVADSGGSTNITGSSVTLNNGTIGNNLTLNATAGDVAGNGAITVGGSIDLDATGNVGFGDLDAQGGNFNVDAGGDIAFASATGSADVIMNAVGAINGGDITAAGTAALDAGDIALGSVNADMIDFTSGADILFDGLTSPNAIALNAANGTIGANTGNGDIDSGGDVDLAAQIIDVGDVTSGGSVSADASAGDAMFGTVDAVGDITVSAAGAPVLANAISGGNTELTGSSVTLNNGTIGGDLTLNATAGDVDGNGAVSVGGAIDLDATGDVGFGDLDAQGGDFTVDAGGDVSFTAAAGSNDIIMNAAGAINGGDINAAGTAALDADNIAVGAVTADMIDFVSGNDILFDGLTSPNAISLTAANGTIGANTGNGDIESDDDVNLAAQIIAVGDVTSGGSVSADASAGDAAFGTVDAVNNITISAAGTPTVANAVSGGDTSITGASVALNNGDIGGDLTLNATAGDVDGNGAVTVAGGIDLDATGNIGFGTLGAEGGGFTADAGGNIDFVQANGAANIDMTAGGDVTFDGIDAATGAGIDAGGLVQGDALSSGGGASVSGQSGVIIDTVSATGDVELFADNGAIAVAGDLTTSGTVLAIGEDVLVNSSGDLAFSDATATNGNVAVTALGNLLMDETDASGDVNLMAGGSIELGQTEAGDRAASTGSTGLGSIILDAGTDIVLGSDVLAARSLSANAGGNVQVDALASGETVDISSADIAIASGAQLGEGDFTTDIQLSNTGTDPMFVGGADTTDGYSLSNDEFGNVQSGGSITLRSDAASRQGDDLIIRDLTASAGQGGNIGADGAILFNGGDNTRIEGAVSLGNASVDNGIFVDAAQGIAADAEIAIVELTDANGGFTGEIGMTAPNITALTATAATDIAGLDAAGIDARLEQNDGVDNPDGIFRADAITFNVTDQLLIQNTAPGTDFDDRRGYTAGTSTLQINLDGPDTIIVINGVGTDAAGNQITGVDAIAATGIATSSTGSNFDQGSTINGCLIADPSSCIVIVPPGTGDNPETSNDRDVIEEGLNPDTSGDPGAFFLSPLIELKDFEDFGYEPLIDEPVTGAGNDDLWLPPTECERKNAEGECLGEE